MPVSARSCAAAVSKRQFQILPGLQGVHSRRDRPRYAFKARPTGSREYDDRNLAHAKILLVPDVSIGRDQHIEFGVRLHQQFAIAQRGPAPLVSGFNTVAGKVVSQRNRRALIKQDAHAAAGSGGLNAAGSVLEDCLGLRAGYARKPGQELVERCTAFDVLEKRANRHARTAEHPRAADFLGVAFHSLTSRPIEHSRILPPVASRSPDPLRPRGRDS
jgi:hypothetical protein